MDSFEKGGPAFPCEGIVTSNGILYEGMTLRDYFAAKAMQGYCTDPVMTSAKSVAALAYEMADAMLQARGD